MVVWEKVSDGFAWWGKLSALLGAASRAETGCPQRECNPAVAEL